MADYSREPTPPPTREELQAQEAARMVRYSRALRMIKVLRNLGIRGPRSVRLIAGHGLGIHPSEIADVYLNRVGFPWGEEDTWPIKREVPQDGLFVLDPKNDPYAIEAIWQYADLTDNNELKTWVMSIAEDYIKEEEN